MISQKFALKNLGPLHYFLGLEIKRTKLGMFISQTKYALQLLQQAEVLEAKPCSTPIFSGQKLDTGTGTPLSDPTTYRSLVSTLQSLTWSRPDSSYPVQQVSQFLQHPTSDHLTAVKRILCYVKGTLDPGTWFT